MASTSNPSRRSDVGRRQAESAIEAFFDQWHVYRVVIQRDYMSHRAIHAAIRQSLVDRTRPFSIADFGCGDGSVISGTLDGLAVREYVGVDLSGVALREIERRFGDRPFDLRLVQSSFSDYLNSSGSAPVDVIIAGFAVHHLHDGDKPRFFTNCRAHLADGGELLLYDVFRKEGQSREDYMVSYCRPIQKDWTALTEDERSSVVEHIHTYDFPVSYETMAGFAENAGLEAPRAPLFSDDRGFHRLYRFSRGSAES